MKIMYVNCEYINEYRSNPRVNEHCLSISENKVQIPYKPEFFWGLIFPSYCLSGVHYCEEIHIHFSILGSLTRLSYICSRFFINSRIYLEATYWSAPNWLVSSVGRALHRYRRGHGYKSRTALNFFMTHFHYCLRLRCSLLRGSPPCSLYRLFSWHYERFCDN